MNFNWLYGPRVERMSVMEPDDGDLAVRSLILEVETVIDVADMFARQYPGSTPTYFGQNIVGGMAKEYTSNELPSLSAFDRSRLSVFVRVGGGGGGSVGFTQGERSMISGDRSSPDRKAFELNVAEFLLSSGTPRVRWSQLMQVVPILGFIALLAAWVWLEFTGELVAAAHVFGWFVVLFSLVGALLLSRYFGQYYAGRYPGHRIRTESRSETYARRADTHKNLKVALITAPITLVIGVGGTLLTLLLRGNL